MMPAQQVEWAIVIVFFRFIASKEGEAISWAEVECPALFSALDMVVGDLTPWRDVIIAMPA